jgi:hypothetical protein
MHIGITLSEAALEGTEIRVKNLLTSVHFKIEGDYVVVRALTLEMVEITLRFRPGLEGDKIVLQDASIEGAAGLANMSESWVLSKIADALEDFSKKVAVHDFHIDADKLYLSISPKKSE